MLNGRVYKLAVLFLVIAFVGVVVYLSIFSKKDSGPNTEETELIQVSEVAEAADAAESNADKALLLSIQATETAKVSKVEALELVNKVLMLDPQPNYYNEKHLIQFEMGLLEESIATANEAIAFLEARSTDAEEGDEQWLDYFNSIVNVDEDDSDEYGE